MSDLMRLIQEIGSDTTGSTSLVELSASSAQAPAAFPSYRCWVSAEETN